MRLHLFNIFGIVSCLTLHGQIPLANAHAHNDYRNARPLLDALQYGFTTVEADIHLIGGELYVSHGNPNNLVKTPSLKALYLEPLKLHIEKNNGEVYKGYEGKFHLMIDIKSDASATYLVLKKELAAYEYLISTKPDDKKPIKIFLSGNRPIAEISKEQFPLLALDGRPDDVGKGYTPDQMPVISENYSKFSPRNKKGKVNRQKEAAFLAHIKAVHHEGKLVRFWNILDQPDMWQYLLDLGVDLINTDKLAELSKFLNARNANID